MNKTAEHLYVISFLDYLFGFPNFWIDDLKAPKLFIKVYGKLQTVFNIVITLFIPFEIAAFFTQTNMTEKQESDLLIFSLSHPMLWGYKLVLSYHADDIKRLISSVLKLKEVYNDLDVEEQMVKQSKFYCRALVFSCILSMVSTTTSALLLTIKSGKTFTTLISAWPLVDDHSVIANVMRIFSNLLWWVFVTRVFGIYITVISLTTTMSYQYSNLQSYFISLNDIFEDKTLSQYAKEVAYQNGLKVGIKLHSDTLRCVQKCSDICKWVFSGQIIFVIIMLVILMSQMVQSERTIVNALATAFTATAVLISTGFFMWNSGDITVEAAMLGTAMYSSGWHNCYLTSTTVRKMVLISMSRAQKPLVLRGLGLMELSYQSFLKLVKTSYSVFSVLY